MQDTFGTIPFLEFMSQYEPFLEQHLGDRYSQVSWRESWKQIVQGGHSICFKLVWFHSQYDQCKSYPPFTENWWQHVPTPLRLKFIGSSTQNIASGARGGQLPSNFTGTLVHYTLQRHLPSITRWVCYVVVGVVKAVRVASILLHVITTLKRTQRQRGS